MNRKLHSMLAVASLCALALCSSLCPASASPSPDVPKVLPADLPSDFAPLDVPAYIDHLPAFAVHLSALVPSLPFVAVPVGSPSEHPFKDVRPAALVVGLDVPGRRSLATAANLFDASDYLLANFENRNGFGEYKRQPLIGERLSIGSGVLRLTLHRS